MFLTARLAGTGAALGCAAQALHSGHCVSVGLRAVAQDRRHTVVSQIGDGSAWQRMRGLLVFKPNAPSLKDPVLALEVSSPLCGVSTRDRNTQGLFSETCKRVVMTQSRGKPVLTAVGPLRAPFLTQPPLQLDPQPMVGAHDTQWHQARSWENCGLCGLKGQGCHGRFPHAPYEDALAI